MFTAQGAALNKVASRNVKVLVVGNSANTTSSENGGYTRVTGLEVDRLFPEAAMGKRSRAEPTIHHNTGMPKRRTSVSSSRRRNGNDGAMNRWSCIRDGS